MAQCSGSPDGFHYTNFPPNGFCRYCGQAFGPAKLLFRTFARVLRPA